MRNISSTSSSLPSSSFSLPSSSTSSPQDIFELILNTYFKESSPENNSMSQISQNKKESPEISPINKRLFLDEESEVPDSKYKAVFDTKDNAFVDKEVAKDPDAKSSSGACPSSPKYKTKSINQKYVKYRKLRNNMDKVNKQCFKLYKTINFYDCYPINKVVFEDCMDNIKNQHKKLDEILERIHN